MNAAAALPAPVLVGEHGGVRLAVERRTGRTRVTELECRPPLQVLRLHELDEDVPDLATAILASPSGGVLDGDRMTLEVSVGPGARLHLGTQSATRVYRTPGSGARLDVSVSVAEGGYLELMPDPFMPYRGSRFEAMSRCELAPGGTLIVREIVGPGRTARGEILAFDRFESTLELRRPGGEIFGADTVRLDPSDGLDQVGLLGRHRCVGSLFVVHPGFQPEVLLEGAGLGARSASQTADPALASGAWSGASSLPADAGAWLRVLASNTGAVSAVINRAWAATRRLLIGAPPPPDHRF